MTQDNKESRPEQIRLTAEHHIILEQFNKFGDKQLSSGELHSFTNIEPVKISAILADLIAHGIVGHVEASSGGWVYILSDYGRKFIKHTEQ